MTARDHNKLLGIFFLINGGLSAFTLIVGIFYALFGAIMLSVGRDPGSEFIGMLMLGIGTLIGIISLAYAAFYFYVGHRMYREYPTGRTLGIIASILSVINLPLGTVLGVYGLWFLFGDMGKAFYEGKEPGSLGDASGATANDWNRTENEWSETYSDWK